MFITCMKIRSSNITSVFFQRQDELELVLFFDYSFLEDIQPVYFLLKGEFTLINCLIQSFKNSENIKILYFYYY
jgi:hypothetical protein